MKPENIPTMIAIFGATGDLTQRKLAPAVYHLFKERRLPSRLAIVGFSRRQLSDAGFRELINASVALHLGIDRRLPDDFLNLFSYRQGVFERPEDYRALAGTLSAIDEDWKVCADKLFYLAVPPQYYAIIFRRLAASGLTRPCGPDEGWTRVLVEKPFGKNLAEAQNLDGLLSELFKEEQIYRIDHYLAKEVLQNIMMFRFANNLLEHTWSNKFIERIDIKLLEDVGIEGRGNFYDGLGALLDVGQSHLLQMLALAAMDNPVTITPETIRQKRRDLLEHISVPGPKEIEKNTLRGQYEGYLEEPGVGRNSTTETYFRIKTFLDLPRWQGVPIILESGKKLPASQKEIIVTFRHPVPCLCSAGVREHYKNYLHFRIQPEPGIAVRFWSKKPGRTMDVEEQWLSFKYKDISPKQAHMEEYPKLLLDCIAGDQTLFVSSGEAMAGWRFIDPIVSAWREDAVSLHVYPRDEKMFEIANLAEKRHD